MLKARMEEADRKCLFLSANHIFMTLIKSISGIRGTIGGQAGKGLTPPDIVKFASAYCEFIRIGAEKARIHHCYWKRCKDFRGNGK